ncbi:MAG: ABC transporter ATP-binding protein [Clostridia bacterium]|nr:ABC transporter ATP-binding protein [Clostridia bacterium]MBQ9737748.1 ABC transporter ATP-binding protein [Clostridia bacterium]
MLKKLASCIGEYKKPSILAPLFVTCEVILEVLIPWLMSYIIDYGIEKSNMKLTGAIGATLVVLVGLSMFCGAMSGRYAAIASAGFAKNLRKKMFYSVQDFSFTNIDKFSTSGLVTRLTTDVSNLQNAYQMIIRIAVRCPAMLAFSLSMAFFVNPRISLIFLAAVPILGGGLILIATKAHPIFESVFKTYDRLNQVVQENLRGIRVVKAFVREDFEENKFKKVSGEIYNKFSAAERLLSFNSPLMQGSMYMCMLLIAWFGSRLIVSNNMTRGDLISLITYTNQILMSLMSFSMIFVMVIISKASAERCAEVLDETSDLTDGTLAEVQDGSIAFKDVFFSYSKSEDSLCLKGINLSIRSGETIGIIGGTGSAKTSLVQLIPRLYDVTKGSVLVGGKDVRNYKTKDLRDSVAMVLQKNELFSGTLKENLKWGNENATDDEIIRACQLAQADSFINALPQKYDTHIEQGGKNVSGGQKQRICIARALLKKPKILILDDSTSAVDTHTDSLIRTAFAEEIPNTTKIIIAQRISSIQHADRIIVMENGEVNAFDTHENLLENNQIYREIYDSQQREVIGNE